MPGLPESGRGLAVYEYSLGQRIHDPVHGRMHPVLHFDPVLGPARLIRPIV
jgi:hypothetical protein